MIRREQVAYLERVKADNMGDRNLWISGMSKLPTWKQKAKKHAGLTPSVLELVSIVMARSPAKPCEEEGEDFAVYRKLQELLDESTHSGNKDSLNTPGRPNPKVGMNLKKGKKTRSRSKIGDQRSYTNVEVIECQGTLYYSDDFQVSIDDVEKFFNFSKVEKICTE